MKARLPANEAARLEELRGYGILDTEPEDAFDDVTLLASLLCGTPMALVSLVDSDRQWFKSRRGVLATATPRDVSVCAHAILQDDVLVVPDAWRDDRFRDNPLVTGEPRIRFYAGAQLVTPAGNALGTLCVLDHEARELSADQARGLRALSRQVMRNLELRRLNERLATASITDDVSGFHNTRFLHHYLDHELDGARVREEPVSLVFFDMDGFKAVVDAHGHLNGARALREVAEAVNDVLAPADRLVRYGGDEYVVILPRTDRSAAIARADRMREAIAGATFLESVGIEVRLTASFGVAAFPMDAADKRGLLAAADRYLFVSKVHGRNRVSSAGFVVD